MDYRLDYHPQQSVLNPHAGQRHTACMRYISAPHRSQMVLSLAVERDAAATGRGATAGVGWP